jgi:hypothetical protein
MIVGKYNNYIRSYYLLVFLYAHYKTLNKILFSFLKKILKKFFFHIPFLYNLLFSQRDSSMNIKRIAIQKAKTNPKSFLGYITMAFSLCLSVPSKGSCCSCFESEYQQVVPVKGSRALFSAIVNALNEYVIRREAEAGDSQAQTFLAHRNYFNRQSRNYEESFRWFSQMARSGNDGALNNTGFMLKNGMGCPKDPQAAVQFFKKAVDGGNHISFYNLAAMYARGNGTPKDLEKAYALFKQQMGRHYYFFMFIDGVRKGESPERILFQLKNKCPKTLIEKDIRAAFNAFLYMCTAQTLDIENVMLQYLVNSSYLPVKICENPYDSHETQINELELLKEKIKEVQTILDGKVSYEDFVDFGFSKLKNSP